MDPESLEETTNVVPDCLRAQLELSCDLLRRAPLLQQTENLALTGCEVRGRRRGFLVRASPEQAKDSDHSLTPHKRHGADLNVDALAGS